MEPQPKHGYRKGVGVVLLNNEGKVFVASRIDTPGEQWQMPQGGLDKGEEPLTAAMRELEEEIGTAHARIVAETAGWLTYDLPDELKGRIWRGKYAGQTQKWYAAEFLGTDADIDLETEHPEFDRFRWVDAIDLPRLIVPFKRALYEAILHCFAETIEALGGRAR